MPNLLLSFAVGFPYVPQPPPPCGNTWTLGRKTARRRLAKAIRLLSVVRYFSPANFSAVAAAEPLQDHQISAIRHRRLPYSKWAYVRRQSRNRLFRKLLASIDSQLQKLRRATCPFINLPEKTKGRWGSWDYACSQATLPSGQTRADRPSQVYRVDIPRPASSAGLSRAAN